ncbi:hypothetical protein ACK3TF_005472 [Chlorella vulgaris]
MLSATACASSQPAAACRSSLRLSHTLAATARPLVRAARIQRSQSTHICRAEGDGEQQRDAPEAAPPSSSNTPPPSVTKREDPAVAKGQRTAIITGAISIIFGVIYLGLVSFLDIRGGELLPPPPEAFENL